MTWTEFLSSQTFGIILGSLLTAGFTWFVEWRKSAAEQKVHLREKREEVYLKVLDVLMLNDKCYRRKQIKAQEYENYKKMYNKLQSLMLIYASPTIYSRYYKLSNDIMETYARIEKRQDREKMQENNADKIEKLANEIRKELGIRD